MPRVGCLLASELLACECRLGALTPFVFFLAETRGPRLQLQCERISQHWARFAACPRHGFEQQGGRPGGGQQAQPR